LIVGISVWFLWGRGCPGGNPLFPKFHRNSWGESGDHAIGSWGLTHGQIFWVGQSNHPGSCRWRFFILPNFPLWVCLPWSEERSGEISACFGAVC
jgi:hypothetical protein